MQDYMPQKKDINGTFDDIYVKQYDNKSRLLQYQIIDKDIGADFPMSLAGCTARMYVDTGANGVLITGEIADGDNGIINFLIPNSATQIPGVFPCEIRITDPANGSLVSTKSFQLHVQPSIFDDNGFEGDVELSALQQALNDMDAIMGRLKTVSQSIDEYACVKPGYLAEIDGYAAQSIAYVGNSVYVIGFSKYNDAANSLIIAFNERTKKVIGRAEARLGHVNSLGYDGEYFYSPSDNGAYVNRFKVSVGASSVSVADFSTLRAGTGISVQSVFNYDGEIYAVGTKDGNYVLWQFTADVPEYVRVTLPNEAPRTNQAWATDGTYLYWLRSNPNAVAIFDFKTGEFIRWSEIGDFVGGSMMIGEVEMMCFAEGEARLISQYYYPNSISTAKRFWLFSELMWSKELPPDQQHWYPNETRTIYVSNAYWGGIAMRTNEGDKYTKDEQTGTENYPYPSLETALYAAMATPDIPVEIIMLNTGTAYVIDDLVLRPPHTSLTIRCNGKVTFNHLHLPVGNLTIAGNAHFERIATTPRARLQIIDGTFTAPSRIDGTAPYYIAGAIAITNGKYTGGSDDIIFEFAGANGVVGFNIDSSGYSAPRSNNPQQVNLVLYNVRNAGYRDRWITVYSGGSSVQIGSAISTALSDFYVNDSTAVRIKWRADGGDYYNTVVNVSGDTIADLSALIGSGTDTKNRIIKMRFRPRVYDSASGQWINGDIRVMGVTDYTVSNGNINSAVTNSGSLPAGAEIKEIAVRGY